MVFSLKAQLVKISFFLDCKEIQVHFLLEPELLTHLTFILGFSLRYSLKFVLFQMGTS